MDTGKASAAASLMREIAANPLEIPTYLRLARVYGSAGELGKAELTLRRAIEIDPLRAESWTQLGTLCGTTGDWRRAADAFEHACAHDRSAKSLTNYATALIGTADLRAARLACKHC